MYRINQTYYPLYNCQVSISSIKKEVTEEVELDDMAYQPTSPMRSPPPTETAKPLVDTSSNKTEVRIQYILLANNSILWYLICVVFLNISYYLVGYTANNHRPLLEGGFANDV